MTPLGVKTILRGIITEDMKFFILYGMITLDGAGA